MTRQVSSLRSDKIQGVIWGQAIGDALGLATEFLSKESIRRQYGAITGFTPFVDDAHRMHWQSGEWSDDTDHLLMLIESFIAQGSIDLHDIAERLYRWASDGGRGIGQHSMEMFLHADFLIDPLATSERVWANGGKIAAPNGALMRGAAVGLLDPANLDEVADYVARCTHHDPRCRMSGVVLANIVHNFAYGLDVDYIGIALEAARKYDLSDDDINQYIMETRNPDISRLNLDGSQTPSSPSIGYTLKTLAAGLWAAQHASSFEEGVLAVVNEGGDADTNAAVAGAMLGAKFGYANIPRNLTKSLLAGSALAGICGRLIGADKQLDFERSTYKAIVETKTVERNSRYQLAGRYKFKPLIPMRDESVQIHTVVLSLSRLANTELVPGSAVISIGSTGCKPFVDLPESTLELRFSDIENPAKQGRKRDRLAFALRNSPFRAKVERFWIDRAKLKFAVVPFSRAMAEEIYEFVDALPIECDTIYIHCDLGQSRSAAVAMALHERYGFSVEFKEESVMPNIWVRSVFSELAGEWSR